MEDELKTCKKCGVIKPREAFHKHGSTRDRLNPWCGDCKAAWLRQHRRENPNYWREWHRRNREKNGEKLNAQRRARYQADPEANARKALAHRVRKDFGLSIEEYDALIAMPCALCGATENIVLDHCHETNRVRGPLCQTCNKALGMLGDDSARLRAAADYLERKRDGKVQDVPVEP